jgi:hypothetical protein
MPVCPVVKPQWLHAKEGQTEKLPRNGLWRRQALFLKKARAGMIPREELHRQLLTMGRRSVWIRNGL